MKGPSFVCDTACSASLTSTHCAKMCIQDRLYDPLDWWLSFGAHLVIMPGWAIGFSQSHMGSPEGRCFTFNASANGYLRGEGTSGILLKFGTNEDKQAILRGS